MRQAIHRGVVIVAIGLLMLLAQANAARAQHGDWLLGTGGALAGAQQPPIGILYQNMWSRYWGSNDGFVQTGSIRCGPRGRLCLSANVNASGSLDLFVDQNIFWLVTPFKVPLINATYGALVDIPFAIVDASAAASLEPVLTFTGVRTQRTLLGPTETRSGSSTKGSIGDIYFEPVDLGWHFKHLDALVTGGFLAPTGPYNSNARLNIGFGHWTGLLGAGGVFYPDEEHLWSLSIFSHYEMYSSQQGRPYTLGDEVPFEWAAGKTFNLPSDIFKQVTIGAVGYAQWQTTDNQVNVSATTSAESTIIHRLQEAKLQIYAAGPGIQLLTKYGLFALRYYDEFGAKATPSAQQLMFSVTLAGNPWGWR
ncbi:MAG TPA: transporter [Candidatus Binataceae bacterium]|nr:transporter [Candidatus Binataceae bacterium]